MKNKCKHKWCIIALTSLNVLLFSLGLFSYVSTTKNTQIVASITDDFVYEEDGNGNVILTVPTGEEDKQVAMRFNENGVKIYDSYQAQSREESLYITAFIRKYAAEQGYSIDQENTDIYGEYALHNILYDANYKRAQTGDADLDFEGDRRWYVDIASTLFGWAGVS
jgi:hypothetical protein